MSALSVALSATHHLRTTGLLWRADDLATAPRPGWPTGHALLDTQLPGGGWPPGGLSELLVAPGNGELRLLAPLMQRLATGPTVAQPRELVWIAAPHPPCAAALAALGLASASLLWVHPRSSADAAWAAEQALRGGAAALVLWWCDVASTATLRRLHLAAQDTPLCLIGPPHWRERSSPAPLRLACSTDAEGRLCIDLFKRRGPPLAAPLRLDLPWPAGARRPVAVPARLPTPVHHPDHALAGHRSAAAATAGSARLIA